MARETSECKPVTELPLLMPIESIQPGKAGVTIAGRIERGRVRRGDAVEIVGVAGAVAAMVSDVEQMRISRSQAVAGEQVRIVLRGPRASELTEAQVLTAARSLTPRRRFAAEVLMLPAGHGGRGAAFFGGWCSQLYFRGREVAAVFYLPGGADMVSPGACSCVEAELDEPVAMEVGTRFAVRESDRTVGSGVVTKLLE